MSEIEERIINRIRDRAEAGLKKYGVTLERTDLSVTDWINHAQEEFLDGAAYLERLKIELSELTTLRTRIKELESRLQEAERLLSESEPDPSKIVDDVEWRTRRDTFLNPTNKDK